MEFSTLLALIDYRLYETEPVKFCPPHAEGMTSTIERAIRFFWKRYH